MKTPAAFRHHIKGLVDYFGALIAPNYHFDLRYRNFKTAEQFAEINVLDSYESACIVVGGATLRYWKRRDWHRVAHALCHEICHTLTEPLYYQALWLPPEHVKLKRITETLEEVRERQTERICKAIMRVVPKEAYTPKEK